MPFVGCLHGISMMLAWRWHGVALAWRLYGVFVGCLLGISVELAWRWHFLGVSVGVVLAWP